MTGTCGDWFRFNYVDVTMIGKCCAIHDICSNYLGMARNGWVTIASIAHHSLFLGGLQVLRCEDWGVFWSRKWNNLCASDATEDSPLTSMIFSFTQESPIVMLGLPDQYFQIFPGFSRIQQMKPPVLYWSRAHTVDANARGFSKGKLLVRWCQTWGCCYWVGIAAVGAATSQLVVVNSLTMAITIINHY